MRASRLLPILPWLFSSLPLMSRGAEAAGDLDPRELDAREKCDSGDVRAGVAQLAQLHAATLNPIYVYRQAQCFQRNGHDENAIERYREYLRRTREVTPKGRQWIETRIRELEASGKAAALVPPPVEVPPTPLPSEPISPGAAPRILPTSAQLAGVKGEPVSPGAPPQILPTSPQLAGVKGEPVSPGVAPGMLPASAQLPRVKGEPVSAGVAGRRGGNVSHVPNVGLALPVRPLPSAGEGGGEVRPPGRTGRFRRRP